jgi:hypothetical protein
MKTACFSKTLVSDCSPTWHHNIEQQHQYQNIFIVTVFQNPTLVLLSLPPQNFAWPLFLSLDLKKGIGMTFDGMALLLNFVESY